LLLLVLLRELFEDCFGTSEERSLSLFTTSSRSAFELRAMLCLNLEEPLCIKFDFLLSRLDFLCTWPTPELRDSLAPLFYEAVLGFSATRL
jgi:hypothetical protein